MAGETTLTIVGNIVADPELRFTENRKPFVTFKVASTRRVRDRDSGEWRDAGTLFMPCRAWGHTAENIAQSLVQGMRVIAQGRFGQRSYVTQEGEKRTVYELTVDEIAPSLRSAEARVTRRSPVKRPAGR